MAWVKRIGLFLAVNALVVVTISVILNVLGVKPYITAYGLDYQSLMIFCLLWGMGGAFISLGLSRIMAKWMMGVQIISTDTRNPEQLAILQMVHELARAARLPAMPEVGIYDSPEVNAFATGPTKSRSLVAVSSGLLHRMRPEEIRGVLGHEVAHIANGDMVTMTLIQGVVNAFVMFLARAIAYGLTMTRGNDSEERSGTPMSFYAVQFVLEMVFMILGSMVVAWFSRYREYRADAGGAKLAGRGSMIQALEGLQRTFQGVDTEAQPAVQALKISSRPSGLLRLFSTHPPLEERIERLKQSVA
ncbi:MAG: protease HtpX [Bacteriovoracia bacterium]